MHPRVLLELKKNGRPSENRGVPCLRMPLPVEITKEVPVLKVEKTVPPPPPCISYANVHNYYGPSAYCSLDKGVGGAQHIQLPTHNVRRPHKIKLAI